MGIRTSSGRVPVRGRTILAGAATVALLSTAAVGCGSPGSATGQRPGTGSARTAGSRTASGAPSAASPAGPTAGPATGSSTGATGGAGTTGRPATSPSAKSTSADNVPPGGTAAVDPTLEYYTGAKDRSVALTFDDGPSPEWTPRILAVLTKYHVHATFCEIGPNAAASPATVKLILAAGDRLCDHSVSHNEAMSAWSAQRQTYEIAGAKQMIESAGGVGTQVSWFRAPGGDFSPLNRHIAAANGLRPLAWSVDSEDWKRPGVGVILANVHREIHSGSIVLMHDGGGDRSQTVAALQQLLPQLLHQGYAFEFPAK